MYRHATVILATALGLAGCADSVGPGPGRGRVTLALATATGPALAPGSETMTLGGATLTIDRVQLVLREIELKRTRDSGACGEARSSHSADDCEELEVGPLLLDLPLGEGPSRVVTVEVDTGTFRELEFEIHKPEDDGRDAQFLQQHPEFARVSIRVVGTFTGAPFSYLSDLNAEQEIDLVPPLVIGEGAVVNLTLTVDLREWFLSGDRTTFVNPATGNKGGSNEGIVKENIKRSFEGFEDDDRDGHRG